VRVRGRLEQYDKVVIDRQGLGGAVALAECACGHRHCRLLPFGRCSEGLAAARHCGRTTQRHSFHSSRRTDRLTSRATAADRKSALKGTQGQCQSDCIGRRARPGSLGKAGAGAGAGDGDGEGDGEGDGDGVGVGVAEGVGMGVASCLIAPSGPSGWSDTVSALSCTVESRNMQCAHCSTKWHRKRWRMLHGESLL
jgi:hypothetical protein